MNRIAIVVDHRGQTIKIVSDEPVCVFIVDDRVPRDRVNEISDGTGSMLTVGYPSERGNQRCRSSSAQLRDRRPWPTRHAMLPYREWRDEDGL
jgi:hypothetical protein